MIIIKIGFIGAGKVGFSLGKYFTENNILVSGYFSKNPESAKLASVFTKTKHYLTIEQLVDESDTIFITTSDEQVSNIWNILIELPIKNKLICHTSGSLSSEIFKDLHRSGAFGYSIHPMFPISDKYESHKFLKDAFFTIEGSSEKIEEITNLLNFLGNTFKVIGEENKSLYHAASVTVSNLYIGLISKAVDYLISCGFKNDEALEALYPLMKSNLENIRLKGLEKALTGPIERCDIETVKGHLKAIPKKDLDIYKSLSKELVDISKEKNANRDYTTLTRILGDK